MSLGINYRDGATRLWDTVTDTTFGPEFESEQEALGFIGWMESNGYPDARFLDKQGLANRVEEFRRDFREKIRSNIVALRHQLADAKAARDEAVFAEKLERARAEGRAICAAAGQTTEPLRTIDTKVMGTNERDRERNLLLAIAVDKAYLEARSELADAERQVDAIEAQIEAAYFAGRLRDLDVREKALQLAMETGAAAWRATEVPA